MPKSYFRACIGILLALAVLTCETGQGKTLRWAARGDVQTFDPYSFNENLNNNFSALVYDALVTRDKQLALVPALATSWTLVNETTWRFNLRHGVMFHDGTPLTAADVVFSIERAQQPTSQISQYARALGKPVAIDDFTVELHQDRPNPILLDHLSTVFIMSRAWCLANHVEKPLDFSSKEESFASRHENGSGPYILKSREPAVRTVLERNPHWWKEFEGNVTELVFTPISSDPTRTAALLSGDVDFVNDPSPQDIDRLANNPALRVSRVTENRVLMFGFDQSRDELLNSNVKGRNPLKDQRVREAIYRAIDAESIRTKIMHGQAITTSCLATSAVGCADPALETHPPIDLDRARKLLAEAGYPDGFELTLDCPNDRYVNDREICLSLAPMLGRIGIKLTVDTMLKSVFFRKIEKLDTSFYLIGWGGGTTDPQIVFEPLVHTFDPKTQKGGNNYGRCSDPELDALIDKVATDMNHDRRVSETAEMLRLQTRMLHYIPLHRPSLNWVSRAAVHPVPSPNDDVHLDWIKIDES
jgi:peptide/nickel transport system substrate-binding protein